MSRLVSPLVHWLLAAVVLMGPIPAMVHHAECHHDAGHAGSHCHAGPEHAGAHGDGAAEAVDAGHDHAGCGHHTQALACDDAQSTQGESAMDAVDGGKFLYGVVTHDEDSCVICQSLASSNGMNRFQTTSLVTGQLVFQLDVADLGSPVVAVIGLSQSRAPPALSI